jgi:glycosyltransferase involved in cell wall biosynthesis
MHIVHVLTRLLRAGSEENTLETCRWQVAAGHRVTLIHGAQVDQRWRGLAQEGIARVQVPELVHPIHPLNDMKAAMTLARLYRQLRPDVIHTHQSKAGVLGRLAAAATPEALVVHGAHILPFVGVSPVSRSIYIAAERLAARRTDLFLAVSQAVAREYVGAGIAPPDAIHCVRSGFDLARFRDAQPPADADHLRGKDGRRVLLMLAAFEPRKRHLAFLQSLAQRAAELDGIRILLAGEGPLEGELRQAVVSLGLGQHVEFTGHRSDPEALLALSDLLVHTSAREGLPRVVVQAQAAGVPVVMNDLPGLNEVLGHGRNGVILPADNIPGVAEEALALLQDPVRLGHLRDSAAATDVSDWALDALGRRTTDLYEQALHQRGSPREWAAA